MRANVIPMLRRLALIFVLLAPLPATAEDGFLADPRNGCKAWIEYIKPDATIRWAGSCEVGYATGRGRLEYLLGGKIAYWIEGEFRNGKREGRALLVDTGGYRFEGEFRAGLANGRGIQTLSNGERVDGEWADGKQTGYGVRTWPNGARFEGGWKDGWPDGPGVYKAANGKVFQGNWTGTCVNGGDSPLEIGGLVTFCASSVR